MTVKVTEAEALHVLDTLSVRLLTESFPRWSGDPRRPERSSYGDPDMYARHPLKPLSFLPIDEWVSKAAAFKPYRSYWLIDGAYSYVREFITHTLPLSLQKTEDLQYDAKTIDGFADAIQGMGYAYKKLSNYKMLSDANDNTWSTLARWVGRLNSPILYEEFHGKAAVLQLSERFEKYLAHLDVLLSDEVVDAINGLLDMASEARNMVPVHEGPGPAPALWRMKFVSQLAHLWRNLYSELPGSNPDHPFIGFVEAVWQTALVCAESPPTKPTRPTLVEFSRERLDELATLNWERKVRETLAEMRQDALQKQ